MCDPCFSLFFVLFTKSLHGWCVYFFIAECFFLYPYLALCERTSFCFYWGSVAIRQILLHICPGIPTFGMPVLGYSLYTWSFLTFCASFVGILILMWFYEGKEEVPRPSTFCKVAAAFIFIVACYNFIEVIIKCRVGPCKQIKSKEHFLYQVNSHHKSLSDCL